jgi:hypothetical protein
LKRKLVLINLVLAGLTAAAGWRLRQDWLADKAHTEAVLKQKVKTPPPAAVAPLPKPDPFTGAAYGDIAQKMLFAKDRNPTVVIEVKAAPPPKPMPPLPVLFGVMGLPSGMIAMMAERPDAPQRRVKVGEKVGEFKVVAMTPRDISFEWEDKKIDKKVDDLMSRANAQPPPAQSSGPVNPANTAQAAAPGAPPAPAKPGVSVGDQMKSCDPGDTSPAGTVVDGFRKVVQVTPFGSACRWVSQ